MSTRFTSIIVISVLLLLTINIFGQAPEGINYQAAIRDELGNPLDSQSVFVRFVIHQNSTSGAAIFTETHSTFTNQFGIVNLTIGSIDPSGLANIDWSTGTYFLQTEIDNGAGFDDLGSTQLMSVPYALYAKNSGSSIEGPSGKDGFNTLIDTLPVNLAQCSNGGYQILIGLDTNANSLLEPGEINASFIVCNGDNGPTGPDGLPINWLGSFTSIPTSPNTNDAYYHSIDNVSFIFNAAGLWDTIVAGGIGQDWEVVGNDMFSLPSGNVGIGTTTPPHKLTVNSNDPIISSFTGSDPNGSTLSISNANSNALTHILLSSGIDSGRVTMNPARNSLIVANNAINGKTIIEADSAIGISSNHINLTSNGIIRNQADTIISSSTSLNVINQNQGTFLTDSLYLLGNNKDSLNYILANNGFGQAQWANVTTLGFQEGLWSSNGSDIFYNNGGIGVGSSSPTSLFQIQTNSTSPSSVITSLTLSNAVTNGNGANGIGTQLVFQGENNAGIMANASLISSQLLDVSSANEEGVLSFQTLSGGSLGERMRIAGNGDIGIGTTSPTAKLDVIGSFKLTDGTEANGNILTSDANGNASWKARQIAFEARPANIGQIFKNFSSAITLTNNTFNDGNSYNASTNTFTAPVNGVYSFEVQITVEGGNSASIIVALELLKNGTVINSSSEKMDDGDETTVAISITTNLSAGDTINIQALSDAINTNSAFDAVISSITGTWFSGHLVYAY